MLQADRFHQSGLGALEVGQTDGDGRHRQPFGEHGSQLESGDGPAVDIVPGLVQTEEYARAIFEGEPHATPQQVEEAVEARIERQAIFDRPNPPQFLAVVTRASCIVRLETSP
jgi:hypothetical protein